MSLGLIFSARIHKESETISDCQDYYKINREKECFAIADGASQSFYPSFEIVYFTQELEKFCRESDIERCWECDRFAQE